ncbi:MAG: hypothetical protein AAF211_13950, partial [Myxococcota bacterium]
MIVFVPALLACQPETVFDASRPAVNYQPRSPVFWDRPWPSDERVDPDGTLDMTGFPSSGDVILEAYLDRAEEQVGFATSAPIYLPLTGSVDPLQMPAPFETDGSIVLVDIDPTSPYWGERFPLQWEQTTFEDSRYQPLHLLAVAPWAGYPLRPATKYALVVSRTLVQRNDLWATRLDEDADNHDADLVRALFPLGLAPDDVAFATVFTTTDPVTELARVADVVQRSLPPADLDAGTLELLEDREAYSAY